MEDTLMGLVNLARGAHVSISQPDVVFDQIQGIGLYGLETPLSKAGMLTDGKYGDTKNWANTQDWFVMYRKMKREVVVDLGQIQTVHRIETGFGQRGDVGITPPINIRFYVSNDGSDYRYVGKSGPDTPFYFENTKGASEMHRKLYAAGALEGEGKLNVQARYVKLVFVINTFGWMDEVEVFGQEGIAEGAVVPPSVPDEFTYDSYAAPGTAESAEIVDQFLWYSGPMTEANRAFTDWTKEKAEAFLAYKDIYGNIKDWYFDDILAIPVVAMVTPSGFDRNGAARYVTKNDLLAYLDFIFQSDTQLGAIDAAAGELNKALKTDKKVRVNMSIPFIEESSNFGDIRGDGSVLSLRSEDFADQVSDPESAEGRLQMEQFAFANKKAAVQWYIEEAERRFQEAGYQNLHLNSFYWYHERVLEQTGEVELIQATAELLKEKGYYFTWIPYIGPASPYIWRDLGFTTASIQPNFAFSTSKKAVFPETASLAKRVGGALEVEYDDFRTLSQYLNAGAEYGYMNDAHNTYYLAAMPIVDGAYAFTPVNESKTPDAMSAIRRGVYDRIYEYVKGIYEPTFGMNLVANISDKSKIEVTVKLPLADSFMEGELTVRYDSGKVSYQEFTLPAALQNKGSFEVTDNEETGSIHIRFKLADANDAIFADLQQRRNPLAGAPDLLALRFSKKDGVDDAAVTSRMFVAEEDASMKGSNGKTYTMWSATDIVPGSPEDELVQALLSVRKAEQTKSQEDLLEARLNVAKLPESPIRKEWMDRITQAQSSK